MQGIVFNIQRFSVHDGPGIRTTVFLKGCNLRCQWCHNPESYEAVTQVQYLPDKCVGCGMCKAICPNGVYVDNKVRVNQEQCEGCGSCAKACVHNAIKCFGQNMTAQEIVRIVKKDRKYFDNSGGGLTVSGGEPLLQPAFVEALMRQAKSEGIHTALDTAANVPYDAFRQVLPYTDLVLLDLKIMDDGQHRTYTGVSNKLIKENARKLIESGVRVQIRVPVIKGINDTEENATELKRFLEGCSQTIDEIRLLPYHNMGIGKAQGLNITMREFETPGQEQISLMKDILRKWIKE